MASNDPQLPDSAAPATFRQRWMSALRQKSPLGDEQAWDNHTTPRAWADESGVPEEAQLRALAGACDLPFVEDLTELVPAEAYLRRFEISYSRQHHILGFETDDDTLRVAICDWSGWAQLDVVARVARCRVTPLLTTSAGLLAAINAAYQERSGQAQELIDTLDAEDVLSELKELEMREDLLDTSGRAPVIKLVNLILFEAVKARASDIHIQPYEDRVVARQRIDGVLFDSYEIPKALQEEVLTRIKVLGRMDIAEKRLPQDGRATVQIGERLVDLRIASLPTSHNERIVIRLLDKSARLYTLGELGMRRTALSRYRRIIRQDHGLILVTGPTGSGKSTTLYASLQEIDTTNQNVLTLEDPIEYQLEGVSQTQINEKKGMTFASGLRNVLRQDPDIIMVGEIRDHETAVMAIQASLTGHLVFSTLHTNDAASAVTRLLDLGIEPYLVASSLVAALAQRLVRRICPACRSEAPPEEKGLFARLAREAHNSRIYVGRGCPDCRGTGFRGRIGLYELLLVDDRCREIVQARGNATQIREAAIQAGLQLLQDDGVAKILDAKTTVGEVLRVARSLEDDYAI
jgi:general secretion pathway protein E